MHTEQFDFEVECSDLFLNHAMRVNVPLSELTTHGLLGQTHSARDNSDSDSASATHRLRSRHIEEVDDYAIADNDIVGSAFLYNRFRV